MSPRTKIISGLVYAVILVIGIYYFRAPIEQVVQISIQFIATTVNPSKPCTKPILYSIGSLDKRFGISEETLKKDIKLAADGWGSILDRNLFEYSEAASLKINLIYDYRQESMTILNRLGIIIKNNSETYHTLKTKYDSLMVTYREDKATFDNDVKNYTSKKATYERDVTYWNSHEGITQKKYQELQQMRVDINTLAAKISNEQAQINTTIATINALVPPMNRLIQELNLNVGSINAVGVETGKQFNEGEYVEDKEGKRINIYLFDDNDQLIRVLKHEIGHALGVVHVGDSKAIMYYYNDGINDQFTAADMAALNIACGIEK